ncbi:hypothetical protein [Flammeovirga sp. SJP92]|uniref:hypothetical protein n=1 Tax=Flammeovirga sp. SJP92 TaxID=1775430 RepID=UPI000789A901|nr:hypothetical protein [Flammeovirga sp. SJP92]KXX70616.1 hypothetical protein AVL50_07280 [Flammeovirga sp. SJP92]
MKAIQPQRGYRKIVGPDFKRDTSVSSWCMVSEMHRFYKPSFPSGRQQDVLLERLNSASYGRLNDAYKLFKNGSPQQALKIISPPLARSYEERKKV